MKNILTLLFFMSLLGVGGVAQTPTSSIENPLAMTTAARADDRYQINAGDLLDIRVFNRPQLSRDAVRVDDVGTIKMPFLEKEIKAACQTGRSLAEEITKQYRELLRNPQVEVIIKEHSAQPVAAVIGSVRAPSRVQLQMGKQIRLLELLAFVGGPTEKVGRSIQVIHTAKSNPCESASPTNSEEETKGEPDFYNLKDTLAGIPEANPLISPGDIVMLPEADQAFVIGNVVKPSTLLLQEPITISQAIAMSGGLLPDTKREKVRLIRRQQGSNVASELIVNLNDIEKRKAEDIALQPNDILEVNYSGGKRLLRSFIGAVVPSVANLPVRVIP